MMKSKLRAGQAYLFQAKEDLCAARILGHDIASFPSTFFMLLQMVFEKLAKADKYWNDEHLPKKRLMKEQAIVFQNILTHKLVCILKKGRLYSP